MFVILLLLFAQLEVFNQLHQLRLPIGHAFVVLRAQLEHFLPRLAELRLIPCVPLGQFVSLASHFKQQQAPI